MEIVLKKKYFFVFLCIAMFICGIKSLEQDGPHLDDDRSLLKWLLQHHFQLVQKRLREPLFYWIPRPSWPVVPSGYLEYTGFIIIDCLKTTCKTSLDCKKAWPMWPFQRLQQWFLLSISNCVTCAQLGQFCSRNCLGL